jgi:SHS2 domain-containing protein
MVKRFEFIEHTADVAVRVFGGSLKELFSSAAMAMFAVLVEKKGNFPKQDLQEISVDKREETMEDLLKAWLDELLFCYATRQLVLTRIKTLECSEGELAGKVLMDRFDPVHYETKNEIKAVTYHELKVARVRNHWEATIIFDV